MQRLLNLVWFLLNWLGQRSRSEVMWTSLALSLAVGIIDYRTGDDLSISVLFVIPVSLCAWVGGRRRGTIIAMVCTLVWMTAQRFNSHVYINPLFPFANAVVLLASFMMAVFLISALKESEQRLEQTVERRTAALKAEVVERQRAQELLSSANSQLVENRDQLAKTLTSLQKAHAELQATQLQLVEAAKMDSVGRLAAGVAHEVKNPLMAVSMSADYLLMCDFAADEAAGGALKDIKEAVKRASSVIGGLLDFASTRKLMTGPQDFNELLESALGLVKQSLIKNHITLVPDLAPDLPKLVLDKNKIEQVFVNIFLNAIHAMPHGGILTVRTYLSTLQPASLGNNKALVLAEIDDTGSGIPRDYLSKIFDPFFTTKPPGEGTGLGLSVVKQIIKQHKGTISIANRQSGGVSVTIFLRTNPAEL